MQLHTKARSLDCSSKTKRASARRGEYAARATTTTPFYTGDTISTEQANYDGTVVYGDGERGEFRRGTTPVANFWQANDWGLHDVHGNVWEMCEDPWVQTYNSVPRDGTASATGDRNYRVARGGSWADEPGYLRSAMRGHSEPGVRYITQGFRVARDIES